MKEFKNVPSKLYEKTNDWITKEKNLTKTKYQNYPESKPKPRRIMSASASHSHRNMQPGEFQIPNPNFKDFKLSDNNNKYSSMFDNYYHDKMVQKKLISSPEEEISQKRKEDIDYQFEAHLRELRALNNIESQVNEQYESIKKAQLKANTPSLNEKGIILQKNNKNFIEENKQKIIKGQIQQKKYNNNNFNKSAQNPYHKDYGKNSSIFKKYEIRSRKAKRNR